MGTKERRERERQDVRQRIMDAARELFVEHGIEAVSMRRIAERIEYSPTAIYAHFADKDDLLRELCQADFLSLAGAFQQIATVPDPIDRLRAIGRAYLEFAVAYPNHYRFMFMTPHPEPDPETLLATKGYPERDAYAFLLATVQDGVAQGRFREEHGDPELIAQLAWGSLHGIISLHLVFTKDPWVDLRPMVQSGQAMIEALMAGTTVPAKGK